jgi:hypothetical protein
LRYGFKAQSERIGAQARESLGLRPLAPLDPWAYARHLQVILLDFETLELSKSARDRLTRIDPESWSGMTIREGSAVGIVLNPSHSKGRQSNTLTHELAHFILKHTPARVDVSDSGIMIVSHYPDDAEAEADWLAGALLLPHTEQASRFASGG